MSKDQCAEELYSYTSGQWLRDNRKQHRLRYVKFDFAALCDEAVRCCSGATRVTHYEKKEGGFNRVFVLSLDNGKRVVAKIPFPIAGPRHLITSSEVATMKYLRSNTSTPIPEVLAWSDDHSTSVGCEYIIMEHVTGVQLHERWPSMDPLQRVRCVKTLGMTVREISKLSFPAYGGIFFADTAGIPATSRVQFHPEYCIGPYCNQPFWDPTIGEDGRSIDVASNRGPFHNLSQYCTGLLGLARFRLPQGRPDGHFISYYGSSAQREALSLEVKPVLERLIQLPQIQEAAEPTVMHYDLHKRNVFVSEDDPTVITGIIDWQSTSVEPGFAYADETPDFTQPLNTTNSNDSSPTDRDQKREMELAQLCASTFEVILKASPKIGLGRAIDENLLRPFRYAATSHRDGIAACRQELVELSQRWSQDLNLPGTCPYQPSAEELQRHQAQYKDFENAMNLKAGLVDMFMTTSDGWVPNELWVESKRANSKAFKEWMSTNRASGEYTEQQARLMWPFDEMDD